MKSATIEDLAYYIQEAHKKNKPKPIVFLGAGASVTGGIPLAKEIAQDILKKYSDNPKIKNAKEEEKKYSKLMELLSPYERDELLKEYIDKAMINITHLYLAQMLKENYIDYVLTVNFDNLMLRALALYNVFPATYDMAILKDLTTSRFKEKSVFYLHGQHHGLWLLNTAKEMAKVKKTIPPILHSIKSNRLWIVIGYSGQDPIFKHIKNLGRFDNGLYWIKRKEDIIENNVLEGLINKENANAQVIDDYDSDTFLVKLSNALGLEQPQVLDKPFNVLRESINGITDIDNKEEFLHVKNRIDVIKKHIDFSIDIFENGNTSILENNKNEIKIDLLKKRNN